MKDLFQIRLIEKYGLDRSAFVENAKLGYRDAIFNSRRRRLARNRKHKGGSFADRCIGKRRDRATILVGSREMKEKIADRIKSESLKCGLACVTDALQGADAFIKHG